MLARIRKSAEEREQGFTLIELLVVMIIIGILAAIAIPVFLSQRAKAQDTAAKNDVSILGKEMATYFVDGANPTSAALITTANGQYLMGTATIGRVSANNTLISNFGGTTVATATSAPYASQTSNAWCVAVYNSSSKNIFKYSAQNGLESGNCTSAIAP